MRRRTLTPLVLAFAVAVSAQSPAEPDKQVGVSVLKFNWHKLTYGPSWDAPRDPATSQALDPRNDSRRDLSGSSVATPMGNVPVTRAADRAGERKRVSETSGNQTSAEEQLAPSRTLDKYTYEARIKNVGSKTIEAVDWEYLFLDPNPGSELARHRFQSFRRAAAGTSLTLTASSYAPPSRVVSAARNKNSKPFKESVVIKCVLYSDGTAGWRAAGTEEDCESIRKSARLRRK